ncbi:PREDICTED: uncharacterized protein LOC104813603 [Tarenaya hassleriana]|uniref:uncharacterized protein LOC104813603 n=1 Tax=Tarenaya hassleriana TaxID=28532 RepID=UPI00053C1B2D|nr:PREDICTED: uncharacterized protein LOC104813603 [Tarenaya hassleriana]
MSNSRSYWRKQRWGTPPQTLTPLMEGPDPEMQEEGAKKESSWEVIREWFRVHKGISGNLSSSSIQPLNSTNNGGGGCVDGVAKRQDIRLLLGVLGCPLAPISLSSDPNGDDSFLSPVHIKDAPLETSSAHYIIQQYLAATGCLKQSKPAKNMYATGVMKMTCCETEIAAGKTVKTVGGGRNGENGCFVLWQMKPGMWSLELLLGGTKLISGSDGKTVWHHTPWLGTHASKGPQRPLRRLIQGLDPKTTAGLFMKAQCLGERRIGDDDCFVLKVSADRSALSERSDAGAPAEVIRHALYGYFCQKSGLLIYLEDSHLTRVTTAMATSPPTNSPASVEDEAMYWETTIGSSIGDYRDVDGVAVAHCGRAVATVFRFEEASLQYSRMRMEEMWRIDDVVFDVPGLSHDSFIPPADIFGDDNHNSNYYVYNHINSR